MNKGTRSDAVITIRMERRRIYVVPAESESNYDRQLVGADFVEKVRSVLCEELHTTNEIVTKTSSSNSSVRAALRILRKNKEALAYIVVDNRGRRISPLLWSRGDVKVPILQHYHGRRGW